MVVCSGTPYRMFVDNQHGTITVVTMIYTHK